MVMSKRMPRVLLLLDVADSSGKNSVYTRSIATFVSAEGFEPAGAAFHAKWLAARGVDVASDVTNEQHQLQQEAEQDALEDAKLRAAWEKKRRQREADGLGIGEEEEEEDLYEILGIGHLNFNANEKQIRKAYQRKVLEHHPDKLKSEDRAQAEAAQRNRNEEDPMFLKVQHAWSILGDPEKRRGYDSQFDFDESIPSASTLNGDDEFFEVFGPVFERNARFSVKKPVPNLGTNETPIAKVHKFYRFWSRFDSWRNFSKFDEFKDGDIESAESRYERRWMQRQNDIIRIKKKKEEMVRIRSLVERAMSLDPRIMRERVAEKRERERIAMERALKKEEEEKARKAAAETERRRVEEEERLAKERADREREEVRTRKKAFKKQVRILKRCVQSAAKSLGLEKQDLEHLEGGLVDVADWFVNQSDVNHVTEAFLGASDSSLEFQDIQELSDTNARNGIAKLEALILQVQKARREKEAVQQRERLIRLEEECARRKAQKAESESEPWSPEELSSLAKAVRKFPPGSRNRWATIANYINTQPGRSVRRMEEDCLKQSKLMASDAMDRRELGSAKLAFDQLQKKIKSKVSAVDEPQPQLQQEADDDWTPEQQSALETALKEFPSSMDKNERWKAIAKAVSGKSKKACVSRFKFLRAKVLMKKS